MISMRFWSWAIAGLLLVTSWSVVPVKAQLPTIDLNQVYPNLLNQNPEDQVVAKCVRLDGNCLMELAVTKSDKDNRIETIQDNLNKISEAYLKEKQAQLEIKIEKQLVKAKLPEPEKNTPTTAENQSTVEEAIEEAVEEAIEEKRSPKISVLVNQKKFDLLTVTEQDAQLKGVDIETRAESIGEMLQAGLEQAKSERQVKFLVRQGLMAVGTSLAMLVISLLIYRQLGKLERSKERLISPNSFLAGTILTQLNQRKLWNLREVQYRLHQLALIALLGGGSLFLLGLFPYTRTIQVMIFEGFQIPLRVGIVALGTYLLIRLSYALINRSTSVLAQNYYLLNSEDITRLQLRITTISGVTRGIVTVSWMAIGILVALSVTGINIGPLLAGAGIIGLAVSLASQNLIKDAINGFFIILEDQYAVGDIIVVGDVGGLVENINLRVTKLRDNRGRLITIPNSEVKIVANLSSNWSRVDVSIPISYETDADQAIALIDQVAQQMSQDPNWQERILGKPDILGVDEFGDRGVFLRVWIKTKPLEQWNVEREFRRRIKVAFDEAQITIPAHIDFRGDSKRDR
ncbi:MAG: mechanosensitive ion channel family protein [Symploca sp. SIO2E6]|nr:mechanosensitive ion channel family protein [Symploca sp. SIO2E6]